MATLKPYLEHSGYLSVGADVKALPLNPNPIPDPTPDPNPNPNPTPNPNPNPNSNQYTSAETKEKVLRALAASGLPFAMLLPISVLHVAFVRDILDMSQAGRRQP